MEKEKTVTVFETASEEDRLKRLIADNLLKAMGDRDITSMRLASLTGISRTSISKYVNAQREPGAGSIKRLCEALEIKADWLLGVDS